MFWDGQTIASKFGQGHGPSLGVWPEPVRAEIGVDAFDISRPLVMPTAGMVDQPGIVPFPDSLRHFLGVKLAPSFIEGDPHGDGYAIIQVGDHFPQLLDEAVLFALVLPAKGSIVRIRPVFVGDQRRHRHLGTVGAAAVGHVLPYQHPQPVAMVIPAQGLHLHMLAQSVEAQLLHGPDVIDHGFIAGRGVQAVRPIALIQHPVEKEGLAVEKQAGNAF